MIAGLMFASREERSKFEKHREMSLSSKMIFIGAGLLCGGTVYYVHWSKEQGRNRMKLAVEADRQSEREELRALKAREAANNAHSVADDAQRRRANDVKQPDDKRAS